MSAIDRAYAWLYCRIGGHEWHALWRDEECCVLCGRFRTRSTSPEGEA